MVTPTQPCLLGTNSLQVLRTYQGRGTNVGAHEGSRASYRSTTNNTCGIHFSIPCAAGLLLLKQAQCHLTGGSPEECFHQFQEHNSLFILVFREEVEEADSMAQ